MMGKPAVYLCLLIAAAALHAAPAPQVREFELTYQVRIGELPPGTRRAEVWVPYPTSDENQEVSVLGITSAYAYRIVRDPQFGNSILYLSATDPEEREINLTLAIRVKRRENVRNDLTAGARNRQLARPAARWLQPDRLVPLDERIQRLAKQVTRGKRTDLEKARAIYDFVVATMSYDKSGSGWGNGDIYWACDTRRGNCTDFHALFTGLNRAVGIPAKFAIGFPIPPERGEGKVGGYHCWAEFFLEGHGWIPVDASEARKHPEKRDYFFGAHDENRVQFSVGRDVVLEPRPAGEPLNYFIYPYVEVDGKPFLQVEKTFHYRDLNTHELAAGR